MPEVITKLVWNEVHQDTEWHAGGLARFYKIVFRPAKKTGLPSDTARTDFYSLYLSYPEGMDHYLGSRAQLENAKLAAQEHHEKRPTV